MKQLNNRQNIIGLQVRNIRKNKRKLSQEDLSALCNDHGWKISRGTIAKIESGVRCVTDYELYALSSILNVPVSTLYKLDDDVTGACLQMSSRITKAHKI